MTRMGEVGEIALSFGSRTQREVTRVPLEDIVVFGQVRQDFDAEELSALTLSIMRDGQLQPLIITPLEGAEDGKYRLISGERRLRALHAAHESHAYVRILPPQSPQSLLRIQLQENLARHNLNLIEQTRGILTLLELELELEPSEAHSALVAAYKAPGEGPVEAFFASLGRPSLKTFYAQHLPLLRLPEALQGDVRSGAISAKSALRERPRLNAPGDTHDASPSPAARPKKTMLEQRLGKLMKALRGKKLSPEQEKAAHRLLTELEELL